MSPRINVDEILDLDSINPNNSGQISDKIRTINKEKRITLYHYVVHLLAFIIIVPFIAMLIAQVEIPQVYSTIVSVVIGFYFAKNLFPN